jgi:hypothetical protein
MGWGLLIGSGLFAFFWFYWLAPFMHFQSLSWIYAHSEQGRWEETQKLIRRTGVDHDSSMMVGEYGDKSWTEWLIKKLPESKPLGWDCGCFPYHLSDAIKEMTNHRVTNGWAGWQTWWATNKDKSQVEWIYNGFLENNIHLHKPLTTNDVEDIASLLKPLPNYCRVNAYRWLRDSDIRPTQISISALPPEDKEAVIKGLVSYAEWYGRYEDAPGKLLLNPDTDPWNPENHSALVTRPACKLAILITNIFAALAGLWLLFGKPKPAPQKPV